MRSGHPEVLFGLKSKPALGAVLLCSALAWPWPQARAMDGIDDARSEARFQLRLAFGRVLDGRFGRIEGHLQPLPDGRWQVAVVLPTADADIPGHARYTRIMRGALFFDSARHPHIRFVSDPFDAGMIARGGVLEGALTLRGLTRRERLRLAPSHCRPPRLQACVLEVVGEVSRSRYGMGAWRGVIGDTVEFRLRLIGEAGA